MYEKNYLSDEVSTRTQDDFSTKESPMRVEVRSRGIEGGRELTDHVRRRLAFALGRFGDSIRRVRVRIEDVNGPRGGMDKRCVVRVSGNGFDERVVEVHDVDVHGAVNQAVSAMGRALSRALDRFRKDVAGANVGAARAGGTS